VRRRTVALALCALAAAATGCGERPEPRGELPAPYPVTVTGAGDEPLVVRAVPQRIVALDPGPAELAARLGSGRRLVGVSAGTKLPGGRRGRAVVTTPGGTVRVAATAELRPDLILATAATDTVDLARVEQRSGAGVYVQPADSVADVIRGALELGFVLGEPARGRRLAGVIRRRTEAAEARVAGRRPVRVFVDVGFLVTVPESSLLGDLVRRAGGLSVAGANPGADPLTPCEIARRRPSAILVVAPAAAPPPRKSPYACRGREPARLVSIPEETVTVAGPRVAASVTGIARALHRDAFR
jgi:ABC-type Fe3+-hydroxamate transport system substrate-binding protein